MAKRRTYSDDERRAALELCEQLGSVAEAARQSGVAYNTLRRWRQEHEDPCGEGSCDGAGDPGRADDGRFKPGHSGNPGGRSSARAEAERFAADKAPDILRTYADLFDDLASGDQGRQLQAALKLKGGSTPWLMQLGNSLLNRGLGREPSAKDLQEAGGGLRIGGRRVDLSKLSDSALREILAAMEDEDEDGERS